MMQHDVVEHRPVHQDIEDGVMALLVDQRAGLEWLVEAFLDHLDDHSLGHFLMQRAALIRHQSLARGFHPGFVIRPVRRLHIGRQHDVEKLLEIVHILPSGRHFRLRMVDGGLSTCR
ncbi:hypothetical protein [Bradyrhizobium sp.]|uniref:hypothetical protein n=1 Tax=Bradyrhizobium sp. TaxID=376 RepID=UPI003D12C3B6